MSSQIFKEIPDYKVLFSMLDSVCSLYEKKFIITEINYKQLKHNDKINNFYEYLRPYYYKSKVYYTNKNNYIGFLTILRQLCKLFDIECSSKTVYGQGTYTRQLCIHIDRHNWEDLRISTNSPVLIQILTEKCIKC
jgi:hypothetical protein